MSWVEDEFHVFNGLNIVNSPVWTRNYATNGSQSSFFVYVPTLLTPSANSPKRLGDLAHSTYINKGYHIYGLTGYLPMSSWSNLLEWLTKCWWMFSFPQSLCLAAMVRNAKRMPSLPTLPYKGKGAAEHNVCQNRHWKTKEPHGVEHVCTESLVISKQCFKPRPIFLSNKL